MQDVTVEFADRLQLASESMSKAMDQALQEFRERLMEADTALTAAMNRRLAILRGEPTEPAKDNPTPPHCTYPNCDCGISFPEGYMPSEATQCPRMGETSASTREHARLLDLFPHAAKALAMGVTLCEFPNCECTGVQVEPGEGGPRLDQCPRIALYEASGAEEIAGQETPNVG